MNLINSIEEGFKKTHPAFNPGDTVKVFTKVIEGDKERLQPFEGVVIAKRGGGMGATFIVRKISFGVGVEKVFPMNAVTIDRIEVLRRGNVRRAKLFYLRDKKGKDAKVKEKERSVAQA